MDGEDQDFHESRAAVRSLTGFFVHALIYIVVNAVLVFINLLTDPFNLWFYWVMLFWGIGLAFHALDSFFIHPREQERRKFDDAWDETRRKAG